MARADAQTDQTAPHRVQTVPKIVETQPTYVTSSTPAYAGRDSGRFEKKYTTEVPRWGSVDEPWLEHAIQHSEALAQGFPVQAHLEYSVEPHLPFTLVLERATPAMAVRAMVSYVEFLASIATPPRARIDLRSVAHLDRSFHRNVQAALEPYFGDTFQVTRGQSTVEVVFLAHEEAWKDYPILPIAD